MTSREGLSLLLALAATLVLAGCSVRCEVPRCDPRSRSCQAQVKDAVVCIRGGERPDVEIVVVDAQDNLDDQLDAVAAMSEEQLARRRTFYRGLALLGLVQGGLEPADAAETTTRRVAGFYDPMERRITLLDGGRLDEDSMPLLVHELVHAQQDAEHDLEALHGSATTPDARIGLSSAIEGEASLYGVHAAAYALGYELDEVDWAQLAKEDTRSSERSAVASDDPFLVLRSAFVYAYGEAYARSALEHGGRAEVAGVLDAPPVSAREVMTGYGAEPPGGGPWLDPDLARQAVPVLPAELSLVDWTGLGAFGLRVLALRSAEQEQDVEHFERYLRGDVLSVFATEDGASVVTAYRMSFATEEAAEAAQRAVRGVIAGPMVSHRSGNSVMFLAHDGEPTLPQLSTLPWTSVPEPEEEKATLTRGLVRCERP